MRRPEREDIERLGEGEVMKSDVQTRFSGVGNLRIRQRRASNVSPSIGRPNYTIVLGNDLGMLDLKTESKYESSVQFPEI